MIDFRASGQHSIGEDCFIRESFILQPRPRALQTADLALTALGFGGAAIGNLYRRVSEEAAPTPASLTLA